MQNNWYAVYTKLHCERKVSLSLTKKNIETFCPLIKKESKHLFRRTITVEPLFKSYVFVKTSEEIISRISKEINGALSLLYWKGKPAIIKEEEIYAIEDFLKYHKEITIEKTKIFSEKQDTSSYFMDGQILLIKNRTMKLTLPSLGLSMIAKYEPSENSISGREIVFGDRDLIVHS
jgi:transcription antitermination factor NusG